MTRVIDRHGLLDESWQRYDRRAIPGARNRVLVRSEDLARYPRYFRRGRFELGLDLAADEAIEDFVDWLPRLSLVQLSFESFADGRAFSQARQLRQRYAFDRDIRARGEVLRDQLAFMYRCGINQFELAPGESVEMALAAFEDITASYQPAAAEARLPGVVNG